MILYQGSLYINKIKILLISSIIFLEQKSVPTEYRNTFETYCKC